MTDDELIRLSGRLCRKLLDELEELAKERNQFEALYLRTADERDRYGQNNMTLQKNIAAIQKTNRQLYNEVADLKELIPPHAMPPGAHDEAPE